MPISWVKNHNWVNIYPPYPLIIITFDDGRDSDYYYAYPEMAKRGLRATTYVASNLIGTSTALYTLLTWEQLKRLNARGWDLQCHSHTHQPLPSLTTEQIHQEMQNVNANFLANDLPEPQHHAFPYGQFNADVVNVIKQYRHTARRVGGGPFNWDNIDFYGLPGSGVVVDMKTDAELDAVKMIIDTVKAEKKVWVVMLHQLVDGDSTSLINATLLKYFIQMIDYIVEQKIRVVTIREGYELLCDAINS